MHHRNSSQSIIDHGLCSRCGFPFRLWIRSGGEGGLAAACGDYSPPPHCAISIQQGWDASVPPTASAFPAQLASSFSASADRKLRRFKRREEEEKRRRREDAEASTLQKKQEISQVCEADAGIDTEMMDDTTPDFVVRIPLFHEVANGLPGAES
eukprot:gene13754-biopygen5724